MTVRFSNTPGDTPRASLVFARRLREARQALDLSQTELAEMMTAAGHALSKPAVLRIENGTRDVKLDEAVAFARVLRVPFADLLEPSRDELVALTDREAVDGSGMRRWLVAGEPIPVWPERLDTQRDRDLAAAYLRDVAVAIVGAAYRGDKAAQRAAQQDFTNALTRIKEARRG